MPLNNSYWTQRALSWWWTFYGFGQLYKDVCTPFQYHRPLSLTSNSAVSHLSRSSFSWKPDQVLYLSHKCSSFTLSRSQNYPVSNIFKLASSVSSGVWGSFMSSHWCIAHLFLEPQVIPLLGYAAVYLTPYLLDDFLSPPVLAFTKYLWAFVCISLGKHKFSSHRGKSKECIAIVYSNYLLSLETCCQTVFLFHLPTNTEWQSCHSTASPASEVVMF